MGRMRIKKLHCTPNETQQLLSIGVSEGTEFEVIENKQKDICILLVEQSTFCIRQSLFEQLETEKVL